MGDHDMDSDKETDIGQKEKCNGTTGPAGPETAFYQCFRHSPRTNTAAIKLECYNVPHNDQSGPLVF